MPHPFKIKMQFTAIVNLDLDWYKNDDGTALIPTPEAYCKLTEQQWYDGAIGTEELLAYSGEDDPEPTFTCTVITEDADDAQR